MSSPATRTRASLGRRFCPSSRTGGGSSSSRAANGFGNEFYELWTNASDRGISVKFLGADEPPAETPSGSPGSAARSPPPTWPRAVPPERRREAFLGTAGCHFDVDALARYADKAIEEKYRFQVPSETGAKATVTKRSDGMIRVWVEPRGHEYAVYADVATGRGRDYSSVTVIDLTDMNIVAELHGKIDPISSRSRSTSWAAGRHHRVAVEMGGGWGEPVIISLRDGKKGRKPYPKLYRHVQDDRPDWKQNITYGFPITTKTRPLIISSLEIAIREEALPHVRWRRSWSARAFRYVGTPSPHRGLLKGRTTTT